MDLNQRLKVLLLEEGFRKGVLEVVTKVNRSPRTKISLERKKDMLLMIVISCRTRIRQLLIKKERNQWNLTKSML